MKNFRATLSKLLQQLTPPLVFRFYRKIKCFLGYQETFSHVTTGNGVFLSQDCVFEKGVRVGKYSSIKDSKVGKYTYFSSNTRIRRADIGRYCAIGSNVKIGLGLHPTKNVVSTHPAFYSSNNKSSTISYVKKNQFVETARISIGHDVWVGNNVLIKDGIIIGNGAIIGAGAIVVKNVSPYAIVGGVPAKLIRFRFTPQQIKFLQKFRWWNKSDAWVKQNSKHFLNINEFTKTFKK